MSNERIIEKIAKLKAHAESAQSIGNSEEAAAFAAAMQRLMDNYNLNMTEVELHNLNQTDPVVEVMYDAERWSKFGFKECNHRQSWSELLGGVVAQGYHCKVLLYRGNRLSFIGRRSDAEIAEYLFLTLRRLAIQLVQRARTVHMIKAVDSGNYADMMKNFKSSFLLGFVMAISTRLREQQAQTLSEHKDNPGALVRLNSADGEVAKYLSNLKLTKSRSLRLPQPNNSAWKAGHEAGETVSLAANALRSTRKVTKALEA